MDLDKELTELEDGAETQAEQVDEVSEIEDVEEFQDDELFEPQAEETDLEDAYTDFYFAEEGPDGEGDVDAQGNDGGLAMAVERAEGIDLSEEGFHLVDQGEAEAISDDLAGQVAVYGQGEPYEDQGSIDAADAEELNEGEDVTLVEPADNDEGYEVVELELDEDDIVRYLEDDEGNQIGFVLLDDEGNEEEYLFVEASDEADDDDDEFDLGITKEGVAEATADMNAIYKDGIAVAAELKGAFDDIKSALDFGSLMKK